MPQYSVFNRIRVAEKEDPQDEFNQLVEEYLRENPDVVHSEAMYRVRESNPDLAKRLQEQAEEAVQREYRRKMGREE